MYSGSKYDCNHGVRCEAVEAERALERSRKSCSGHMLTVDTILGCSVGCLFCPMSFRGLRPGTIQVKTNLIELLQRELSERERNDRLPSQVLVNPASDAFGLPEAALPSMHETLRLLLEAGIQVQLKTRALVPQGFESLFRAHAGRIHADVALFSMEADVAARYEPGAAAPQQRLNTIRRLLDWGVDVRARIDPMIPFVSDTVSHLEDLVRHLRSAGVERAVASYLVLRPKVLECLKQSVPTAHFHLIKGCFKRQPWQPVGVHQMTKLLPKRTRAQGYARLESVAERAGLQIRICACQNPGMGASCYEPRSKPGQSETGTGPDQLNLFKSA
jgi:DNA repair photolyase